MSRSLLFALVAAVAAAAGLVVAMIWRQPAPVTLASGTQLPSPRVLPAFTLQGSHQPQFTQDDLKGHWTVVFVGFTACPDVCPGTLQVLKNTLNKMPGERPQVLLLSIDPARDTPERLKAYVESFDPAFRAATAADPALEALGKAMGFAFIKVPGASPDTYTMDHSSNLFLLDDEGRMAAVFTAPLRPDLLASDFAAVMAAAKKN